MEFRFATKDLETLYTEEKGADRYPPEVVAAFFRRMFAIANAHDERDLRSPASVHFEKLKGFDDRYSMRLNKQWRLELMFQYPQGAQKIIVVLKISKHYGD